MRNLVILGAGTGGTVLANMLSHELDAKEWKTTIIDAADEHVYQPGLLFIPFRLYDYQTRGDITRPIAGTLPSQTSLVKAEAKLIDHESKRVETSDGTFDYDWLVCALGCRVAPEEIDGMAEALGRSVHTFYTLDGALEFQRALGEMTEGRLLINIAEMPIKCPVAPIEFAFLADYYFHRKGIRDRVQIELVTPLGGAFTKPIASEVLSRIAAEKDIRIVPNFTIESVDAEAKTIQSFEGASLDYDMLCVVPPNLGPDVIEDSGLGDGAGYGLTHPRTLASRKAENVYFIGDNSNVTASKAGSVAHFESETVVSNILREMRGEKPLPSFDGHTNCFVETGFEKALLVDFNYDLEPVQGRFPLPGIGPFSLLEESHVNHMGKLAFKWAYWHMLLPGRMAHVPLMPSHMSFMGKDLESVPQIRRSRAVTVENVMTKEVVHVSTGTPLVEAAKTMAEHNVSGLPVMDVDDKLIGVVSEADFLAAMDVGGDSAVGHLFDVVIRRRRARKTMGSVVDDIMTPRPLTLRRDDTLQKAIDVMDRNGVKRLFVTDESGGVEGVITRADVVKLFLMKG